MHILDIIFRVDKCLIIYTHCLLQYGIDINTITLKLISTISIMVLSKIIMVHNTVGKYSVLFGFLLPLKIQTFDIRYFHRNLSSEVRSGFQGIIFSIDYSPSYLYTGHNSSKY